MTFAPGLYIHIPYCETKCPYCDFACEAARGLPHPREFLEALAYDLEAAPGPYETLYIGGGTPTAMGIPLFRRLLALAAPRLAPGGEWTVEANPVSLTREKAAALSEAGVTRVSLGVQSVRDEELAFLGRIHRHADTVTAVSRLRAAGIPAVSVDFIFGLPRGRFSESLAWAVGAEVEHISLYDLTIEVGTPFASRPGARISNDRSAAQYAGARRRLADAGYEGYEVSNFARPGFESRHNRAYWEGKTYDAAGPGAHSYDGERRTIRVRSLPEYIERARARRDLAETVETVTPARREVEALLSALRTARGLTRQDWGETFDRIRSSRAGLLAEAEGEGLLDISPDRIAATTRGLFFLDSVLAQIA